MVGIDKETAVDRIADMLSGPEGPLDRAIHTNNLGKIEIDTQHILDRALVKRISDIVPSRILNSDFHFQHPIGFALHIFAIIISQLRAKAVHFAQRSVALYPSHNPRGNPANNSAGLNVPRN